MTGDMARRAGEHLRESKMQIEKVIGNLSKADARAVEQALIETHKLGKHDGTLRNLINSISARRPEYASQLRRGLELLESIGYETKKP